jgi:hypothetical protein
MTTLIPGIDPGSVTPVPIDGELVTGSASTEVRAPYDGTLLGSIPSLGAAEVDRAVAAAKKALHDDPLPQWRRAEILDKAVLLLTERQEDFARCVALEAAKPIRTARAEAQRAVSTLQFSAAAARTLAGDVVPMEASAAGAGKLGFILRVPIGVVGAIAPFNFPLNLVVHKLGPAIAAGCPVVLKPASQTPSRRSCSRATCSTRRAAAGLPPRGHRWRRHVGNPLVDHDDVALITFTGSPEVGWGIRARAPRKRVGLELGNNAPLIIEPDGDWRARRQEGEGRRLLARGPVVHLDAAHLRALVDRRRRSSTSSPPWSTPSWWATRSTRPPTCRPSSTPASATACRRGSRRPSRGRAPRSRRAARSATTACSPTAHRARHPT